MTLELKAAKAGTDNMDNMHSDHPHQHDHHDHHAHMAANFRKWFWISLVLTLPILILSPQLQKLTGLREAFKGILGKGGDGREVKVVSPGYLHEQNIELTDKRSGPLQAQGKTVVLNRGN
jgi:cation transport ATPase